MTTHETEFALADRVTGLPQTEIRAMLDLAEARGGDPVSLAIGEPDFDTPAHVVEAAAAAAADGATHYTSNLGIPALREAIADEMRDSFGVGVDPDRELVVTAGGIQALYFALLATTNPGEEVVLPTPAWPSYDTQAAVLGAELVEVPLSADDGFDLDPDAVAAAMGPETAAVVVSSPNNPTGRVFESDAVAAVVEAAAEHDAYVVADEVYGRLTFDGGFESVAALTDYERVLVANSFSKTYAMTGWRVGWLAGPEAVVSVGPQMHQAVTTCASSVSQHAALAALEGEQAPFRAMRRAFRERREYVVDRIAAIPEVTAPTPEGGFYCFPDVSALDGTSVDVARRLLDEYGVVTVPGTGFGEAGEGHLRMSFATGLAELETAFDRFEAMVRDELG